MPDVKDRLQDPEIIGCMKRYGGLHRGSDDRTLCMLESQDECNLLPQVTFKQSL